MGVEDDRSPSLNDVKANDYVLTLGRYVEVGAIENAKILDDSIRHNLEVLGYGS